MTQGWGDLDGYGPQQVYINLWRTSQNSDGNYSSYHITVRYLAGGYGSWTSDTQSWAASTNLGHTWSGNFSIPQPQRYDDITLLEADFTVAANGDGFGPAFESSASIWTNHSSIGSGTVIVGEAAPPRIPKPPTAPQNLRVVNVTATNAGVQYDGPADWRGSSPQGYTADWYEIGGSNPLIWRDLNSQGYTSPQGGAVPGAPALKPGTTYHVYVYARSNVGDGPSVSIALTTLSAAYVGKAGTFAPSPLVAAGKAGGFPQAQVLVSKGGGFVNAG